MKCGRSAARLVQMDADFWVLSRRIDGDWQMGSPVAHLTGNLWDPSVAELIDADFAAFNLRHEYRFTAGFSVA